MRTLQLVRGCVTGRAGHFHVRVPAVGAHGRNTTVRDTNFQPSPNSSLSRDLVRQPIRAVCALVPKARCVGCSF